MSQHQFCTFFLDELFFGVEVLQVQEVIRYQSMTRVPLAPTIIRGLINLRGQIVTALDLRRLLNFPDRDADDLFMNVIIHSDESAVSLLVDEIGDVLEMNDENFEVPPYNLDPRISSLLRGVYKLDVGLLLVLDTDKIVNINLNQFGEFYDELNQLVKHPAHN